MAVYNVVLVSLLLAVSSRGERVHFRIYTSDLLDQHTHTRTVYIHPHNSGLWNDKGAPTSVASFGQGLPKLEAPLTVSSSTTLFSPIQLLSMRYPIPSSVNKPRPARLVHPQQRPNSSLPPATSMVYHSPAVQPVQHQKLAPLKAPTPNGCGSFANGNENVDKGNCYVEQYENGYRDEEERKTFYDDGKSNLNTEKHGEHNSANYRNEAVYHLDKKRRPAPVHEPSYPTNTASIRPPFLPRLPPLPPKVEELPKTQRQPKQVYLKPLKNSNVKFIVRPSDIQFVRVQNVKKPRPGDDVKLVEITKSRRILPGTKIDTVKIVENTQPLPEDEEQSDEDEPESSRQTRQKSKDPKKSYQNIRVRGKITRVITPSKSVSESKVSPLWSQDIPAFSNTKAINFNDVMSLADPYVDGDGYKVFEDHAEANEVPSSLLADPGNGAVRGHATVTKPRRSVKPVPASSYPFFDDDSWTASQTEVAKRLIQYWKTNPETKPSEPLPSYGNQHPTMLSSYGSALDNTSPEAFRKAPPFYYVPANSFDQRGMSPPDTFVPTTLQEEFLPSDPKHPVANGRGKSEQAVLSGEFEHSAEEDFDMPSLGKIISTRGHVFQPTMPPPMNDAFGSNDPDRLDSDGVPVVEESSHKRKGYKETHEHEQKRWR